MKSYFIVLMILTYFSFNSARACGTLTSPPVGISHPSLAEMCAESRGEYLLYPPITKYHKAKGADYILVCGSVANMYWVQNVTVSKASGRGWISSDRAHRIS